MNNISPIDQKDYFINLPTSRLYLNYEEITETKLQQNFEGLRHSISFYREYPDIFVDEVLTSPEKPFEFYPVQRIMMRVFARYRYVFATFNRGFSKSFIGILFQLVMCILYPRNHLFITAGTSEQGTKIADDKITELLDLFPKLGQEIEWGSRGKPYESTRDSLKVTFKNRSTFELVGALQSNRGRRKQGGIVEECVLIDGDRLSQVIIPMMNVPRKVKGKTDPNEIHKRQLFVTSAGYKSTFSYDKLMQILLWQSLKDDGKTAFVLGGSWELPVKMGLLEADFVDELKEDGTYNDQVFEREYGSIWSGTFEGSFFDPDQFDKLRKLKKTVLSSEVENNIKYGAYYIVSMDVGRLNDRSVVCVFRVYPNPTGTSDKTLVYMDQYEQEHFEIQAYKVKELIEQFNARILVIDANGLGAGLVDYLVRPTKDIDGKDVYPPYAVLNDERYDKYKTDDSIPMIYNIKANAELNNAIAVNVLTQMSSNKIKFLIDEKLAKINLAKEEEEHKKPLTSIERARKLKPHILTSQLKEEMLNLRRKKTNDVNSLVTLEQVNRKLHKDKYSAFSYGLYWIKLEDDGRKKYKQSSKFKSAMLYNTNSRWK